MDAFDIYAKITLDSSEYDRKLDAAGKDIKSFGSNLQGAGKETKIFAEILKADFVKKGVEIAIAALKKLGEMAVNTIKQSISAFADYQQLIGGMQKLYGDAAETVTENAQRAFDTMGISANEYMQTLTSFSSMLIESLGKGPQQDLEALESTLDQEFLKTKRYLEDQYDEYKNYWDKRIDLETDNSRKAKLKEQRDKELKELKRANEDQLAALKASNKQALEEAERQNGTVIKTAETYQLAADVADMAMQDMADNASVFGKSTEEVMAVYQSLAKGMYTTLDNLNLPFKGTKEGMQDLINKANELRGSNDLSIDSFADIVVAIHEVQLELGITGNAGAEAEKTISGSSGRMKAAWHNLVAGLSDDNADLDKLIQDFISAAKTYVDNLTPVIERAIDNLIEVIERMLPTFIELGLKVGGALLKGLIKGLGESLLGLLLLPLKPILKPIFEAEQDANMYRRANGGFMQAGQPYRAGEFGAEMIVPAQDSYAYTASETAGMFGRGITININGDVYDDENSMARKLKNAVVDIVGTELAYG